jgi:hypothetical protein
MLLVFVKESEIDNYLGADSLAVAFDCTTSTNLKQTLMKQLKHEIKMLIVVKLLGWLINLLPKNKAGFELINAIVIFLETDLKQ